MPLPSAGPTDCSSGLSLRIFKALQYDNPWAAGVTGCVVGANACPTVPNGFGYTISAITTGTTGGSEPAWPVIINNTVVDNGVTWKCVEVANPSGKGPTFLGFAYGTTDLNYLRFLAWNQAKGICDEIAADNEAWTAVVGGVGFANLWANNGAPYEPAGYFKDASGLVHLRGVIITGTMGAIAFTLPLGYRPSATMLFAVNSAGAYGACSIASTGTVTPAVGSNAQFGLDGISFDTR